MDISEIPKDNVKLVMKTVLDVTAILVKFVTQVISNYLLQLEVNVSKNVLADSILIKPLWNVRVVQICVRPVVVLKPVILAVLTNFS
jgi:hypothetical protein